MRAAHLTVVIASAFVLGACSKPDSAEDTAADTTAGSDTSAASAAAPSPDASTTPEGSMTVEDIEHWKRGMEGELAAVREAGKKFKAARSSTDSLSAMMETQETATRAAGARAAGIDENRYNRVRSTLSSIVRYMAPMDLEMDTKQMPASVRATMQQDRDSTLARTSAAFPPAVIDALRPRAAELRKQELALVQERLRAAGMIR